MTRKITSKALELLKKLVEIPSPSGKEDELMEFIVNYLENIGFSPEIDSVKNIILDLGADLWVTAHIDTVKELSNFSFDGEFCYGTGVADDKASIASILLALELADSEYFNCAFFVDEEETGFGSQHFAEKRNAGRAIVMEPTELRVCSEHWGVVEFSVTVEGKPAHAATPWAGINAVEKTLSLIDQLKEIGKKYGAKFNILQIKSVPDSLYAVPHVCYLKAEYLLPDKSSILFELLDTLEGYGRVEILEVADPFVSGDVVKILENAVFSAGLEVERSYMPSWTDAVNLHNAGWDTVVFGPGKLELCHTPHERVSIQEVIRAAEVLKNLGKVRNP